MEHPLWYVNDLTLVLIAKDPYYYGKGKWIPDLDENMDYSLKTTIQHFVPL